MKIKFFISLIYVLTISTANASDLNKIIEKGVIEFAVYENFPPYSYKGKDGGLKGIDIDLGKAIGQRLGVQAGFRLFQADESVEDDLRNVVWKGHYLAGGISDVMLHVPYDKNFAKENDKVTFVQPYYQEVVAFVVNTSRIPSARTLEVFINEPIGVETESLSDAYLLGAFGGRLRDNVKHFTTVREAVEAMVTKDLAAVMGNRGELEHSLGQHKHDFLTTKLPTPGLSIDGWELCAAVDASNQNLAKRINEIIGELKASGQIKEIFDNHGISHHLADSHEMLQALNSP